MNAEIFTEKQRLRMCEESLRQLPLTKDNVVDFLHKDTGPQKFYKLDLRSRNRKPESRTVKAFNCPTKPAIYLEVHYWKSQGFTAWVIVKESELDVRHKEPTLSVRQRKPVREPPKVVTRRPRDIASSSAGSSNSEYEIKNYKVKFVEDIKEGMLIWL